jgi:hypothetical protein
VPQNYRQGVDYAETTKKKKTYQKGEVYTTEGSPQSNDSIAIDRFDLHDWNGRCIHSPRARYSIVPQRWLLGNKKTVRYSGGFFS